MKKLVVIVTATFALLANAEWKTIGTAQLADTVSLAQGISKLGEFTGNAMIGMMAAGLLNDLPGAAAFGPGRKGVPTLYPFFVQNGQHEFAILYPVALTKAAFLKKYPDAVESNGLIRVKCPVSGKRKTINYAAFSADGKWVGLSDNPQQARLALEEIATAEKPMDGDMIKVRILKRGLDEYLKGGEKEVNAATKDIVGQLGGLVLGLRVSDKGLDIRAAVKANSDSELAKIGKIPLAANPLAFAGNGSVSASATAADCGQRNPSVIWNQLKPVIEKTGFKLDWLEFVQKNVNSKFTLDFGRLIAFITTADNKKSGASAEKALEEIRKWREAQAKEKFKSKAPAVNLEFALKGYAGKFLPAQRFAYTLPEVAEKKPFAVGFFSLYSLVRTLLPQLAKVAPDECPGIETVIAALPAEGQGGMAYMAWSEKDFLRFFLRIGADEFKAVSAGFAAFAAMSAGNAGGESDDDDPDDDLD